MNKNYITKRIIILASERSGTNLLRVLLGNHNEISAPVAVHFFNNFCPILEYYGDLNELANVKLLVQHMLLSANHNYTNWNLKIDYEDFISKYHINSIESAFNAMYRGYALQENKVHYVVKDNDMFNYIDLTEELKKDGQVYYIHLYRDPRDHVVSWLRTPLFLHSPYDIAKKWNKEQNKIKNIKEKVNMFLIRYEDLITNTPQVMTNLFEFLDIPVDKNAFTTDPKNQESKNNELWKNLSKPVLKDNKNKYKEILKGRELKIVETICKQNMLDLGYCLDTSGNWKDYFGFYEKNILPKKRADSIKMNKEFFDTKMKDLNSKQELLKVIKSEVINRNKN